MSKQESYFMIGNLSEAFKSLEKSFQEGYKDWEGLLSDESLKNFRNLPEFAALLKKYKKN